MLSFVTGKHETSADGGSARGAIGMWKEKQARKFVKFQYAVLSTSYYKVVFVMLLLSSEGTHVAPMHAKRTLDATNALDNLCNNTTVSR